MTTEILGAIRQYRDGLLDFDDLVHILSERGYPRPARYAERSEDPFAVEMTDAPGYDEGTWDEVLRARNIGLLTPDEYTALAKAAWTRSSDESGVGADHRKLAGMDHSQRNRSWLEQQVAEQTGLSHAQAERAVAAVLSSITNALARGEEVRLTGFGTFRVTRSTDRGERTLRTGEHPNIAAGKRPAFLPGPQLKEAVASE